MGGNVDYTGGLVLQLPLREGIHAAAQSSAEPVIRIFNHGAVLHGWASEIAFPIAQLGDLQALTAVCSEERGTRWGRYVLGAFHALHVHHGAFQRHGARLYLDSTLPANRGVGSSAALEISVLKAAAAVAGVRLEGVALAEAGQWVENVVAQSACGIMDQAACVIGEQGCLLPLLCQPCQPEPPLALPDGVRIWGIDSLASRSTTSAAYESARAAAFMGYRMLCQWEGLALTPEHNGRIPRWTDPRWNGYLSNLRPSELRARHLDRLPESMRGSDFLRLYTEHVDPFTSVAPDDWYPVRAAVLYACEEHLRIEIARALLQGMHQDMSLHRLESQLRMLGELMHQSHHAYAECGLGATSCDILVELAQHHGLYGAKMTGGGGGGVVALLGTAGQEDAVRAVAAEYAQHCGIAPHIFTDSSDGADLSGVTVWEAEAALGAGMP
ncbi:galactokinase [Silvibacterium dinghuense]|nr:galactokinase [Silvibacterium dinghuense]